MIKNSKKINEFDFRTNSLIDLVKVSVKYLFDDDFRIAIFFDNSSKKTKIPIVLRVKRHLDYDILSEDENIKKLLESEGRNGRNRYKS